MKRNTLISTFFVICCLTSNAANSADELPTVIALFGDSTTVGYVPPRYSGDPEAFEDRIAGGTTTRGTPTIHLSEILNEGEPVRPAIVTNWGYGGTSSGEGDPEFPYVPGNGLSRIDSSLANAKATHAGREYFVLIIYGTNDFGVGISSATTGFNIEQMIVKARNHGFEPIIGTTVPRSDRSTAAISTLNGAIASAANSRSAFLVDQHSVFGASPATYEPLMEQETHTSTGNEIYLHPKREGYRRMAQKWLDERLSSVVATDRNIIVAPAAALAILFDDDEEVVPEP